MNATIETIIQALDGFQYSEVRGILNSNSDNISIWEMAEYLECEIQDPVKHRHFYAFIMSNLIVDLISEDIHQKITINLHQYWNQVYQRRCLATTKSRNIRQLYPLVLENTT